MLTNILRRLKKNRYVGTVCYISSGNDGNIIENVQEFFYLGKVILNNNKEATTEQQTSKATAKLNELRSVTEVYLHGSVLTDHNVNVATRRKLLEACVRSRLSYSVQAWKVDMKKLEVC